MARERFCDARTSPNIRFGPDNAYGLELAVSIEQRRRAWTMVYESYLEKGYSEPRTDRLWYGLHDALPDTRTLLVTRDGEDMATLTLVFDSPLGLPADELYRGELDALRKSGRRLCEITSLVSKETSRAACLSILKNVFHYAYLLAFRVAGATDFVITVNPHHTTFYERKVLFKRVGEERSYDKVGGAPAVLLRLSLVGLRELYDARYSEKPNTRSFYRFFVDPDEERALIHSLRNTRVALSGDEIKTWFGVRRPLLEKADTHTRAHLQSYYSLP